MSPLNFNLAAKNSGGGDPPLQLVLLAARGSLGCIGTLLNHPALLLLLLLLPKPQGLLLLLGPTLRMPNPEPAVAGSGGSRLGGPLRAPYP